MVHSPDMSVFALFLVILEHVTEREPGEGNRGVRDCQFVLINLRDISKWNRNDKA